MAPGDVYAETLAVFDQRADRREPLTTPEVADALDAARRTVYKRLEELAARGDLETKKAGARARVWWRPAGAGTGGDPTRGGRSQSADPATDVEAVLDRITDGSTRSTTRAGSPSSTPTPRTSST